MSDVSPDIELASDALESCVIWSSGDAKATGHLLYRLQADKRFKFFQAERLTLAGHVYRAYCDQISKSRFFA